MNMCLVLNKKLNLVFFETISESDQIFISMCIK